ncbi:RNA polymerase sigma factor [Oerskovia sp. NPDC057915]|uniref:RNA polymerase sigma factor n=1 Tax=Oerskovia sp. NPDC057915 TaxID=3346280 RepID=UPI0036DA2677
MTEADDALSDAWREHWARLLAMLIARYRRPDLAEDALADAFAAAARTWPVDGVPDSPAAWLRTAAGRRVLDRLRAEAVAVQKVPLMIVEARSAADAAEGAPGASDDGAHLPDERLRLVFSCCHPALSVEARTALTLRFVAGLPVPDIARLFLVQDSTMAARLTRAKKRLVAAGIPFEVPPPERLGERIDDVASVLYLTFTAGYAPGTGPDVLRVALAGEAIRLGRLLDELLPGRPVVRALLALMVLQHSRRDARTAADGSLVLLADQDRSRWRGEEIASGLALLASVPDDVAGPAYEYRLQASIAAAHAVAGRATDTDWGAIADLYADLEVVTGSAMVRLARSVAVAEARGPATALDLIDDFDGIDEVLRTSHRLPATRAELLARAGRPAEAAASFEEAVRRCGNAAEREHLARRLAEVRAVARR